MSMVFALEAESAIPFSEYNENTESELESESEYTEKDDTDTELGDYKDIEEEFQKYKKEYKEPIVEVPTPILKKKPKTQVIVDNLELESLLPE